MQVRYMEWDADLKELDSPSEAKGAPSQADEHPAWLQHIPEIDDDVSFDVILGSDIMYEVSSAAVGSLSDSMGSDAPSLLDCTLRIILPSGYMQAPERLMNPSLFIRTP